MTTDASGIARAKVAATLPQGDGAGVAYQGMQINVTPERSEEGEISGTASVIVFPASVLVRPTGQIKDGALSITGDAWNVDLDVFSQGLKQALYPYYAYGLFNGKDKPPFLTTPVANTQLDA